MWDRGKPLNTTSTVDWFSVHLYVAPLLESVDYWPVAGTLAWQQLEDGDPVKLAAICDGARHWALRVDTFQEAMAEASRAISKAADWTAVAHRIADRPPAYIPRLKETM